MERNKLIQLIYSKLAELETERNLYDFHSKPWCEIDTEMDEYKQTLQDVMNSKCPLIKESA